MYAGRQTEWRRDGLIHIVVPKGAVNADGVMKAAETPALQTPAFPNHQALSPAIELTGTPGIALLAPIELTFLGVGTTASANTGTQPAVFAFNETLQRWVYAGGTAGADGTVTARADRFATFAVFDARTADFLDLRTHWALPYAQRLVGMDALSGYPDRLFHPEDTVTRAQFARMLSQALGLKAPAAQETDFRNRDAIPAWARSDVAAVTHAGLMQGDAQPDGPKDFGPERPITRAEMAVIAANALRAYAVQTNGGSLAFADEHAWPSWAEASVHAAASTGLMRGDPDGAFHPLRSATRAEAAAVLYRLLDGLH